jgi:peptidoglycan/xylan/chitin deacetylase (PgdA/CDA1 family)
MSLRAFQLPRLDRLASVYIAHPLAKLTGWTAKCCVPILHYHSISENLFGKVHPYNQINTSAFVFAKQMRWLRNEGYRTLSLPELLAGFDASADLSKKIVITFDDGYRDFYTDAFPVLRQCGFGAAVFLATDRIQNSPARLEGADYLSWSEVKELHAQGMIFGSHSVTHADLRSLTPEEIDYEICGSKELIEDKLGAPVDSFSYPFEFPEEDRDFTQYLSDILQNCGYCNGVSSTIGRATPKDSPLFLPRLRVNSWDDVELLRAKLEGGYDWLHLPQLVYKFSHHNVIGRPSDKWAAALSGREG